MLHLFNLGFVISYFHLFNSLKDFCHEIRILFGVKKLSKEDMDILDRLLPYFIALKTRPYCIERITNLTVKSQKNMTIIIFKPT
jgi:hypothetical protein